MLIRVSALLVVPRNRRPSAAMAWLMLIMLLPVPGIFAFWVVGIKFIPKKRRERQKKIQKILAETIDEAAIATFPLPPEPRTTGLENAVKIGRTLGAFPMLGGNIASLHPDYHESIAQMARAIDGAKEYVHLDFYILVHDKTTDPVFKAMQRAAMRGVKIRVLMDWVAAVRNPGMIRTKKSLNRIGADWRYMLPLRLWRLEYQRPDLRNHRKIVVVDGAVAFMGSQNLIDSSYNKLTNRRRGVHWKDVMVRVAGPSAQALNSVFISDWYEETGEMLEITDNLAANMRTFDDSSLEMQVLPSGPGYATENNLQVFVALMYNAVERISITSPYFVPDGALMSALTAACARGVEVELFVSEMGDQFGVYHAQRSYYEALLVAGVKIYLFRPPYILHSKHFSIDKDVAVIGSSNMDQRSFTLNYEVSLIVHGEEFVSELDEINTYYREHSRPLTREEWRRQPIHKRLLDNLMRLTSALQ
ncbi:MAG: cardiolipin synthase [Microbacteriaceae bacterium]|nr:cardiolipin synthase [Microbacteriaceae bacterium]